MLGICRLVRVTGVEVREDLRDEDRVLYPYDLSSLEKCFVCGIGRLVVCEEKTQRVERVTSDRAPRSVRCLVRICEIFLLLEKLPAQSLSSGDSEKSFNSDSANVPKRTRRVLSAE